MRSATAKSIVDTVDAALGPDRARTVALHEPLLDGNERAYVAECIETNWVSSAGRFVDRLESMLVDLTGAAGAVAVVNGTAALHIALHLAGVERGDEVLAPALTFVATANAIVHAGGAPHFVDVDPRALGMDGSALADYLRDIAEPTSKGCVNRFTSRRIRAVVPMHAFGHPVDLEPLIETCARFGLVLVEDAAESLGSLYKGRHAGTFGRLAALSFNGNKIVTAGGGGAILASDPELAARAKHLTTTAKKPHRWRFDHDQTAYNYRMPNINAALCCAQLERLPLFLQAKRALADRYAHAFQEFTGARLLMEPAYARSNYWLNALILDSADLELQYEVLELAEERGLQCRPVWTPMHRLPMYADCPRMPLSHTEDMEGRIINIPSSAALGMGYVQKA